MLEPGGKKEKRKGKVKDNCVNFVSFDVTNMIAYLFSVHIWW